jgi:hypothetical protein
MFHLRAPVLETASIKDNGAQIRCKSILTSRFEAPTFSVLFVLQHDGFSTKSREDTVTIAKLVKDEFERVQFSVVNHRH